MTKIYLKHIHWSYKNNTITICENATPRFDTEYLIISPNTGVGKEFKFTHSTGPEFDPNTKWIYKSEDNILLEVCNDPVMVKKAAAAYLKGKLQHV